MGAEVTPEGVHFRVWAPKRNKVEVATDAGSFELEAEGAGYFSGIGRGSLYKYRLDGGDAFPDPASRFQPEGPHGPSQVVDPSTFPWTDEGWRGLRREGQVLYEMHVGTFTPEGTWEAASRELPELARLGVTVIEMMPVAEFPGRFGWGYDGVDLFAPCHLYGEPDDLRRFLDRAHAAGLGVILDVVYNHFGPDGNYLRQYADAYFTDRYENDWGDAIDFEPGPVREFFFANAGYWTDEFHFDGLRLDATQDIHDASDDHILAAIGRRAREAARGRSIYLVAENEPQETRLVRGFGLDALWNDDFHHTAIVALTGRNEAYYTDYLGTAQELVSAVKYGYLYQGQRYSWQKKRRGAPGLDLPPPAFVSYIQNHDQIANSGRGARCHLLSSPGRFRAMTTLLLLAPATPMLFQGQEFCASAPFLYFADHVPELARNVSQGRMEFLAQFPSLKSPEMRACIPDPHEPSTFEICRLDLSERASHAPCYALHRDLLRLRREDPVFRAQGAGGLDGSVLTPEAFVLRFFSQGDDRLLIVNLGRDLHLVPAPEPLLAPPEGACWEVVWSSEDPRYGGCGAPPPEDREGGWRLPGQAAVVLRPRALEREERP